MGDPLFWKGIAELIFYAVLLNIPNCGYYAVSLVHDTIFLMFFVDCPPHNNAPREALCGCM